MLLHNTFLDNYLGLQFHTFQSKAKWSLLKLITDNDFCVSLSTPPNVCPGSLKKKS